MTYEVWNEILEVLMEHPNRVYSVDGLVDETEISKENIQQALYRAYRRGDVERVAPGMYRSPERFRRDNRIENKARSSFDKIKFSSKHYGYEINIPVVNLQIMDEIIGQLKLIRSQVENDQ